MRILIKKEVFQKFHPDFKVAFILASDLDNQTKVKEAQELLQEIEEMTLFLFPSPTFKAHSSISPWAIAQQKVGSSSYHTSLEKLLKKVLKRKKIKSPEVLPNLLNYLSLKYLIPVAWDDFHKIKKELVFQLAKGTEKLTLFKKLKKGALYYRDKENILGLKLDFWKSSQTKPDKRTTCYLIHLDALPPFTLKKLREIVKELCLLIETFCQGKTKTFFLSKKKNSLII